MISQPKGHKYALSLLAIILSVTQIYNWMVKMDFRISTNDLKRTESHEILAVTEYTRGGFLGGKNPELLARMPALPNLVRLAQGMMLKDMFSLQEMYKERFDRVQSVCWKYGLGTGQKIVEEEKGRTSNGTGFYKKMLETSGKPVERSLMHLQQHSLLFCWIHKVRFEFKLRFFLQLIPRQHPHHGIESSSILPERRTSKKTTSTR